MFRAIPERYISIHKPDYPTGAGKIGKNAK